MANRQLLISQFHFTRGYVGRFVIHGSPFGSEMFQRGVVRTFHVRSGRPETALGECVPCLPKAAVAHPWPASLAVNGRILGIQRAGALQNAVAPFGSLLHSDTLGRCPHVACLPQSAPRRLFVSKKLPLRGGNGK